MTTFFAIDWEIQFGLPTLAYERLVQQAMKIAPTFSLASEPCPFGPGKVKDTHFLFLGLTEIGGEALTILKWEKISRSLRMPSVSSARRVQLDGEYCANSECGEPCLYLVPTQYVLDERTFEDQVQALPSEYQVSKAVEMVEAQYLYFQKTGRFFGGIHYGRCADILSNGDRVMVGCGESDSLHITRDVGNHPGVGLGLAVHRKILL